MPDDSHARLHATVHGFVQGVNFRANTQREAVLHGLTGWVRNRSDGSVEVVAEGPRAAVEKLALFLHHGPRMAQVERVDVTYGPPTGEFGGFNIRY